MSLQEGDSSSKAACGANNSAKDLSLHCCCPHSRNRRGGVFQTQHVGPMEGHFTGQKSIVHLISKSADMLFVLYYLQLSRIEPKHEIWGSFRNSSTYPAAHAKAYLQKPVQGRTHAKHAVWFFNQFIFYIQQEIKSNIGVYYIANCQAWDLTAYFC